MYGNLNVGKYTIHGCYGIGISFSRGLLSGDMMHMLVSGRVNKTHHCLIAWNPFVQPFENPDAQWMVCLPDYLPTFTS